MHSHITNDMVLANNTLLDSSTKLLVLSGTAHKMTAGATDIPVINMDFENIDMKLNHEK